MRVYNFRKKGQIIIMYSLALFVLAGIIGLAVDGGWAFYVKKHAQLAADGAAMAAAKEALRRVTSTGILFGTISCTGAGVNTLYCTGGSRVVCGSSLTGSPSNLYAACQYATSNGFAPGGQGGTQNVTIESGLGVPPTGEGLSSGNVFYWVTVRATQSVPQLFSALLGNSRGLVAARSTAAIVTASAPISIYGLNREGDCTDHQPRECGIDIEFEVSSGSITANGGMVLDSNCTGKYVAGQCVSLKGPGWAGTGGTSTSVTAPSPIVVRGGGTVENPGTYHPGTVSLPGSGSIYQDPTQGLPQPPVATTAPLPTCGIKNGTIPAGATLGPYNYYSYSTVDRTTRQAIPDGSPITVTGAATFSSVGTCPTYGTDVNYYATGATPMNGSAFPVYLFHGGLIVNGSSANVVFGPGQYVMDGVYHANSGSFGNLLKVFDVTGSNPKIASSGSGSGYAGQLFIFTAPTGSNGVGYPGLDTQVNYMNSNIGFNPISSLLWQGKHEIEPTGTGASTTLYGLNDASGTLPSSLQRYNGFVFWQDRRNSIVKYTSNGTYNCAPFVPGGSATCIKTAAEDAADRLPPDLQSPEMELKVLGQVTMDGVSYQPRGAWFEFQGSGARVTTKLQIITGTVFVEDNVTVNLLAPTNPAVQTLAALVE